jgi:hypothetical protein
MGQTVYALISESTNAGRRYQIDAEAGRTQSYFVKKGFSGAPVFDRRGNFIWGMIAQVDNGSKLVAYAIPAQDLRKALAHIRKAVHEARRKLRPSQA